MGWRNSRWRREPPARAAGSGSRRQGRCVSTCGARTSGLDGCGRHSPPLHSPAAAGCLQSARQGQPRERDAVRAPHAMHAARHADAGVSDGTYEWRCTHTCTTARGAARRRAHRLPRGLDGRGPFGARARRARRPSATSQAREGAQPERAWRARARANLRCPHTCSTARGAARRPSSAARPGRPRAVGARARRASRPSATSQAHEGARPERVACARARKPAEAGQRVHRCAMSRACHARGVRAGSERRVARALDGIRIDGRRARTCTVSPPLLLLRNASATRACETQRAAHAYSEGWVLMFETQSGRGRTGSFGRTTHLDCTSKQLVRRAVGTALLRLALDVPRLHTPHTTGGSDTKVGRIGVGGCEGGRHARDSTPNALRTHHARAGRRASHHVFTPQLGVQPSSYYVHVHTM